jgi:chromosome segregation ATPase
MLGARRIGVKARGDGDPEFPEFWVGLDRVAMDLEEAKARANKAGEQLKRVEADFESRRAELERRVEALTQERDELDWKVKNQAARLSDSSRALEEIETLKARLKDAEAKAREDAEKAREADRAKADRDAEDLKAEIKAVGAERDRLKAQVAELNDALAERDKRLAELAADRDRIRRESDEAVAEARSSASVAVRMQALRDADLRDLQDRYASVVEERDAQASLLSALTARLSEAETYLNQIDGIPDASGAASTLPEHQSSAAAADVSQGEATQEAPQPKSKRSPAGAGSKPGKASKKSKASSGRSRGAKAS